MGRYRADIGWHKSLCGHSPFHVLGRECFLGLESFSTQVVTSDHEEVPSRQINLSSSAYGLQEGN